MRQIQNRDDQACNGYDNHKLFVCTHMHPPPVKAQDREAQPPYWLP